MALLKCICCGRTYTDQLDACPHCHFKVEFVKCPECGKVCAKKDNACSYCGCPTDKVAFLPITVDDADQLLEQLTESVQDNDDVESLEAIERKLLLLGGFKNAAEVAQKCHERREEIEHQEWVRAQYQRACSLIEKDQSPKNCEMALSLLKLLGDYEYTQERIKECQSVIDGHKKKVKKKAFIIVGAGIAAIIIIIIGILVMSPCTLLDHKYDNGKVTKEPTCGESGSRTFTCERCGNTYTNSIASTGDHKWSEWKTTVKATYDHGGTKERYCKICGETETEDIEQKERPASYYKDQEIINTDGKLLKKVYVMDGSISFSGSFSGNGNFIVEVLDSNQDLEELVCNEIGSYYLDKTVYVGTGWHYIQVICSDGSWEMTWYGTGGD